MAKQFGCSKELVYKKLKEKHLSVRKRYSTILDENLKQKIMQVHMRHPKCGYVVSLIFIYLHRKETRPNMNQ